MSLKYHLAKGRDLRKGAQEGDKLFYAHVRNGEQISIRELSESISQLSSASPADVSCVLRGLQLVLKQLLVKGNIVELGDLGNFRMTAGSKGVEEAEKFHTSLFKKARIVYTPGSMLKEITGNVSYSKMDTIEVDSTCDLPHS